MCYYPKMPMVAMVIAVPWESSQTTEKNKEETNNINT